MTTNTQTINLKQSYNVSKFRISMIRFNTNQIGARVLYIKCDHGLSQHPLSDPDADISEYTKIFPMYSGIDLDILYVNDTDSYDAVFSVPQQISQIKVEALINGNFSDSQISALNPIRFEIEIVYEKDVVESLEK